MLSWSRVTRSVESVFEAAFCYFSPQVTFFTFLTSLTSSSSSSVLNESASSSFFLLDYSMKSVAPRRGPLYESVNPQAAMV